MSDFAPILSQLAINDVGTYPGLTQFNKTVESPGENIEIELGSVWTQYLTAPSTSIQTSTIPTESLLDLWTKSYLSRAFDQPMVLNTAAKAQTGNEFTILSTETRGDATTLIDIQTSANGPRKIERAPTPEVEVIAEWDGHVEAIYGEYFTASMQGLRGDGVVGKVEDAEIPISDVDPGDRDLLVQGGFFRLMIAYESPRVGPRKRYTTVQFRRLPAYTKRELDAAEREANELINGFQLEESSKSAGG